MPISPDKKPIVPNSEEGGSETVITEKSGTETNDFNRAEIVKPTREAIVREFNIPPEFFTDKVDVAMLEPALEIITGNLRSTPEEIEFAGTYIKALTHRDNPNELSDNENKKNNPPIDRELSDQLIKEFSTSDTPFLKDVRESIGIADNGSNEKPFVVQVWDIEGWDNAKWVDRFRLWAKETGNPTFFVRRNKEDSESIPTLNLSKDDARVILGRKDLPSEIDEREKNRILSALKHEYRHLQRSFTSKNDKLFRAFDEACTDYEITDVYQNRRILIELLALTTGDFNWNDVFSAYAEDGEEKKVAIINSINTNFGPLGVLLLGAKGSIDRNKNGDGLPDLPIDELSNQNLSFIKKLLELRSAKDPYWLKPFSEGIAKLPENELDAIIRSISYLCKGYSYDDQFSYVKDMIKIIKIEKEKRKIAPPSSEIN